jgi:hypothetical protein
MIILIPSCNIYISWRIYILLYYIVYYTGGEMNDNSEASLTCLSHIIIQSRWNYGRD